MATFLRHEPCPKCGSRDNLSVWSDGSNWCWGCHYYKPGKDSLNIQIVREKFHHNNKNNEIFLPDDFDYYIPAAPLNWLKKYGITDREIASNRIGYSEARELLIFPVFSDSGELLMWQGRYFGEEHRTKYFSQGMKGNVLHLLGKGDIVILTEDVVSAIKVGRVASAVPLFGSHASNSLLYRLSRLFSRLGIWLDRDKAKEAVRASNGARALFKDVRTIVTPKDPKEYSTEEIRKLIYND